MTKKKEGGRKGGKNLFKQCFIVTEILYCYKSKIKASLVAQWWRDHLLTWETWVQRLIREEKILPDMAEPVRHND